MSLEVSPATPEDAAELCAVIHASFAARPPVDPPPAALAETTESVATRIREVGGMIARVDGQVVGGLLFAEHGPLLALERVCVDPARQQGGVASALVAAAEERAQGRGFEGLHIAARAELPATVRFWERQGYAVTGRNGPFLSMSKLFAVEATTTTAEATRALGERLARRLVAGDLVILDGDLGSGKTTFTQGLGAGLGVRGDVTSPTFVISRVHPSTVGGPALVHVDAYRLGGLAELEDLDLDTGLDEAVTVVEWGEGVAESLSDHRLEISLRRARGALAEASDESEGVDEPRRIRINPVGDRWVGAGLADLVS